LTGAVIVTTPQDISLLDARKGLLTFTQLKVPVLGIVENMSYFVCENCDHRHEIFSHGGGKRVAEELGLPFLGEIPIDPAVVAGSDQGKPIFLENPDAPASKAYRDVAGQIAAQLSIIQASGGPQAGGQKPIMPEPFDWKS